MSRVSIVYCPLKNEAIQYTVRQGMEWPDVFTQRIYIPDPDRSGIDRIDLGYIHSVQEVTAGSRSIDGIDPRPFEDAGAITHRHTVCTYCTYCT